MSLAVAARWFETKRIDDDVTLLYEPHVDPLLRCNIWHVRGRGHDPERFASSVQRIASVSH